MAAILQTAAAEAAPAARAAGARAGGAGWTAAPGRGARRSRSVGAVLRRRRGPGPGPSTRTAAAAVHAAAASAEDDDDDVENVVIVGSGPAGYTAAGSQHPLFIPSSHALSFVSALQSFVPGATVSLSRPSR
jgi:hypothetical protein